MVVIACALSVVIASLRAVPIELFYIAIISIFLSILFTFVLSETKKTVFSKGRCRLIIFLCTYVLLLIWLGLSKVIPEYTKITEFEKNRYDLVFKLMTADKDDEVQWRLKLARHYLSAPTVIIRNEYFVRYHGAKMMEKLLTEKVEQDLGSEYRHDMFYLADFAFHSYPDIAKRWYNNAYEAGRLDALERYEQRLEENFKDSEVDRLDELEKYNQLMREKHEGM